MITLNVNSNVSPDKVHIDNLPDGRKVVLLSDNIHEVVVDETIMYEYDCVEFDMPSDREDTIDDITRDFNEWWEFGQQEFEEITLEQRITDLEELVISILGGDE